VISLASFLGGTSGFGTALVSAPLLLLLHFSLGFVVTANLALGVATRLSSAVRFRRDITWRPSSMLVAGSLPGLSLGAKIQATADVGSIRTVAGVVVMGMAALLGRSARIGKPRRIRGGALVAGLASGVLATTTSLNGAPPALLLARERVPTRTFIADLAVYFVLSNTLALVVLAIASTVDPHALWEALAWLPGSLLGNHLGGSLGPRLPERGFRRLTLAIAFLAGAITALTG
jgi:uncharacterized protein